MSMSGDQWPPRRSGPERPKTWEELGQEVHTLLKELQEHRANKDMSSAEDTIAKLCAIRSKARGRIQELDVRIAQQEQDAAQAYEMWGADARADSRDLGALRTTRDRIAGDIAASGILQRDVFDMHDLVRVESPDATTDGATGEEGWYVDTLRGDTVVVAQPKEEGKPQQIREVAKADLERWNAAP